MKVHILEGTYIGGDYALACTRRAHSRNTTRVIGRAYVLALQKDGRPKTLEDLYNAITCEKCRVIYTVTRPRARE